MKAQTIKNKDLNFELEDPNAEMQNVEENYAKNFLLIESQLKDFGDLLFLDSSTDDDNTALLYIDKEYINLYLFILENIIDVKKENISYKIISKLKFTKSDIDKIYEKERETSEEQISKPQITEYNIFLINKAYVIMQVQCQKIILIDFIFKKYTVLYSTSEKRKIKIVSTFKEELELNQTRTYIFCISDGKLYFFLINQTSQVFDYQFILNPFPFQEQYEDFIDFTLMRIENQKLKYGKNNKTELNNKYYFIFLLLLNGRFIRYVTNWVSCTLRDFLQNFKNNLEKQQIQKCENTFDQVKKSKISIYRSEKFISFIILQLDFQVFAFKYYESDTPSETMNRFGISNDSNLINSYDTEISAHNLNFISSSNREMEFSDSSINKSSGKFNMFLYNKGINIDSGNKNTCKNFEPQISISTSTSNIRRTNNNVSVNNTTNLSSSEHNESTNNFFGGDIRENNHNGKSDLTKMLTYANLKTKDKEVFLYSLDKYYGIGDLNDGTIINNNSNINNISNNNLTMNKTISNRTVNNNNVNINSFERKNGKIIFLFTFNNFISFIRLGNSIAFWNFPEKTKEKETQINKIKIFNELQIDNNIQILDVLHYHPLKFTFLLTNKFILKFRISTDLYHFFDKLNTKNNNNDNNSKEESKIKSKNETKKFANIIEDKKNTIYYKLKVLFKYHRSSKNQKNAKCKLCGKINSKLQCKKCKQVYYCSENHKKEDYRLMHFFLCEIYQCIDSLEIKGNLKKDVNLTIKAFQGILNQMFIFISTKKDYAYYMIFIKLMLKILSFIDLEDIMNKILTPLRTLVSQNLDIPKVCDIIFTIELWFFYCNLDVLGITFALKSEMYLSVAYLLQKPKIFEMDEKRDKKLTMFAYFALSKDLAKYDYKKNEKNSTEILSEYSKNFFFDLFKIYTNDNKNSRYLYIYEHLFSYYLDTCSSLLKISLFLKTKGQRYFIVNTDKYLFYVPKLFEDKLNNLDNLDIYLFSAKLPLILIYFYLSFILVKVNKVSTAVLVLRFILERIRLINNYNTSNIKAIKNNATTYPSLEAKILLNIGVLMYYNGNYNLAIHHLENCYRLCFEKRLSVFLKMKIMELLCLAYINIDKISSAYILIKSSINERKKFLCEKKEKFNKTLLIYQLNLFKLRSYLLFLNEYIEYRYKKLNSLSLTMKHAVKNKKFINQDDTAPTTVLTKIDKISPSLIHYICENDIHYPEDEEYVKKIMDKYSIYLPQLDSNVNNLSLYCSKEKMEMIIKALQFLDGLSDKEFEILNINNGPSQKEEIKEEGFNLREKSGSVNKDFSTSTSRTGGNKEKLLILKEENLAFFDEIDVKMDLYDKLGDTQQKELKNIQNNVFRRSILLRDPKGSIDKFNLNYHPKYSIEFAEMFDKLNENIFVNQLENFGQNEHYEERVFEDKTDTIIYCLRKFLNLEKIKNILFLQKFILFNQYKKKLVLTKKNDFICAAPKSKEEIKKYAEMLKQKICKEKFLKNINLNNVLEKIVIQLDKKELEYIIENPHKIYKYVFINEETFRENSDPQINYNIGNLENLRMLKSRNANKDEKKDSSLYSDNQNEEDKTNSNKKEESKKSVNIKKEEKKVEIIEEKKEEDKEDDDKKEETKDEIHKALNELNKNSPKMIFKSLVASLAQDVEKNRSYTKKKTINYNDQNIKKILGHESCFYYSTPHLSPRDKNKNISKAEKHFVKSKSITKRIIQLRNNVRRKTTEGISPIIPKIQPIRNEPTLSDTENILNDLSTLIHDKKQKENDKSEFDLDIKSCPSSSSNNNNTQSRNSKSSSITNLSNVCEIKNNNKKQTYVFEEGEIQQKQIDIMKKNNEDRKDSIMKNNNKKFQYANKKRLSMVKNIDYNDFSKYQKKTKNVDVISDSKKSSANLGSKICSKNELLKINTIKKRDSFVSNTKSLAKDVSDFKIITDKKDNKNDKNTKIEKSAKIEKNTGIKEEDKNKPLAKARSFIEIKKPTYAQFREKVLHRKPKVNEF